MKMTIGPCDSTKAWELSNPEQFAKAKTVSALERAKSQRDRISKRPQPNFNLDDQPKICQISNIFRRVCLTLKGTLTARTDLQKGSTVFYETLFAAKWNSPKTVCGTCAKKIEKSVFLPCNFCSHTVFCGALCQRIAALSSPYVQVHLQKILTRIRIHSFLEIWHLL